VKVVFVCLGDFKGPPGARQILLLARELVRRGHECLVLVEGDPGTVRLVGEDVSGVGTGRYRFAGPRLSPETHDLVAGFRPEIVHVYEPRTAPLAAGLALSGRLGVPLCVRYADDDELLYREAGGSGLRGRVGRPALLALGTVAPRRWPYKHPFHHRRMLDRAAGYDAITPALAAEVGQRYGVDCEGILPAIADHGAVTPGGSELRHRLRLPDGPLVLYTGSVFRPHYPDFEILLRAFATVAERHPDAQLVHTGRIADRYAEADLRALVGPGAGRLHLLGFLERPEDLAALQGEAAALVQPGAPTDFNRLRLPAKLHDYLLAGRPVVTFAVGFGELLEHQRDAVLTQTASPEELAGAIGWVLENRERAEELGRQGRRRALELFDPDRVVAETVAYYEAAAREGVRAKPRRHHAAAKART